MKTIKQIFKYFEKDRSSEEYINAFEEYRNILYKEEFKSNSEGLINFIQIKMYKYCSSLIDMKNYDKVDKIISELEDDFKRILSNMHYKKLYESYMMLQVKNLHFQKRFLKSNSILKKLLSRNNSSSKTYLKWYLLNKKLNFDRLTLFFVIFCACLSFLFVQFIEVANYIIGKGIMIVGIVAVIVNTIYGIILKNKINKAST